MRLIHYSDQLLGDLRNADQREPEAYFDKPHGLWISVEGEDDWPSWCRAESFMLDRLSHAHEVELTVDARILHIANAAGIDRLTEAFGCQPMAGFSRALADFKGMSWPRVAERYQGIIIAPYVWSRRLVSGSGWYCGWDCASGCIWDASAIAQIRLCDGACAGKAAENSGG